MLYRPQNNTNSIVLCLTMVIATALCSGNEPAHPDHQKPDRSGYLTFYLENDLFSGTDGNYTNGSRLSYITEAKPAINIPFIQKNLKLFSGDDDSLGWMQKIWGFNGTSNIEYSYGFALTQLMFTPETYETMRAPGGERPYAAWLGVSFSLHARDHNTLNSVELSYGTVGPRAYAQESQDFIHEIIDEDKFRGWDSQIPNEFTFNIIFNQKRRWDLLENNELPLGLKIDGFHETGYAIGNYLTDIHFGAMIRIGWNLPTEYSDPRLSETSHTQKLYNDSFYNQDKWSVYGILGGRGASVFRDITLDGPMFTDFDTGVKKEPFVGEVYAGFGVRRNDWGFDYVHTLRSREFKSQADSQWFGSVAIRKRF
jgi:lipid A 3-O-deacylase